MATVRIPSRDFPTLTSNKDMMTVLRRAAASIRPFLTVEQSRKLNVCCNLGVKYIHKIESVETRYICILEPLQSFTTGLRVVNKDDVVFVLDTFANIKSLCSEYDVPKPNLQGTFAQFKDPNRATPVRYAQTKYS